MLFLISLTITVSIKDYYSGREKAVLKRAAAEGALRVEPEEFRYPQYTDEIKRLIFKKWEVPENQQMAGAVVVFEINRDGTGSKDKIAITDSTGDKNFNSAAIMTVLNSYPFQPLPKEFKGESIKVYFEFTQID